MVNGHSPPWLLAQQQQRDAMPQTQARVAHISDSLFCQTNLLWMSMWRSSSARPSPARGRQHLPKLSKQDLRTIKTFSLVAPATRTSCRSASQVSHTRSPPRDFRLSGGRGERRRQSRRRMEPTPFSPDQQWNFILYSDECLPAIALGRAAKKVWAVYWVFKELERQALCIVRSSIVT